MGGVLPSGAELHIYKEGEKESLCHEKRNISAAQQKQFGTIQTLNVIQFCGCDVFIQCRIRGVGR